MSQSLLYHAFGVREGYDYQETRYQDGCLRFVLSVRPDWIRCPACVRYTRRLQAFVEALSGRMTISNLAAITGLGWDTVKDIVKGRGWKRIMAIPA